MSSGYQGTKNLLKKVLPMPANSLNREFSSLREGLSKVSNQGNLLTQSIQQLDKHQADTKNLLSQRIDKLQKRVEQLDQIISNHLVEEKRFKESLTKKIARIEGRTTPLVLWSRECERNVVKENWGDVTAQEDFAEKFIKLTKGLDSKSVQAIIRILLRQKAFLNSDEKSLNLFTRAEQEEIRLLRENFNSEILKLSDNIFAYRNYLLPINHFESSVFYFKHGIDEVETLDKVKGKTVIDVGGFIGDSVLIFNELNPKRIYTFEASPENFELMQQTLKLNDVKNVIAEKVALGAERGTCTLHMAESGTTTINRPGLNYTGDLEVSVITLDDYVTEHGINDIGLIKVDIEGGEPHFLEGAKQTICSQKPILLLSIYHNAHDFFELKPLVESWNLGYKFKIHKPTFGSASGETLLIAEVVNKEIVIQS